MRASYFFFFLSIRIPSFHQCFELTAAPPSAITRGMSQAATLLSLSPELVYPAAGTMAAVMVYIYHSSQVGGARDTYKIKAPATTGHPVFERVFRTQQNTLEQLAAFVPTLWVFALAVSPKGAWYGSLFWCATRIIYGQQYYHDAKYRGVASAMTVLTLLALAFPCCYFVGMQMLAM
jgi:uncharacterized MAPEG superfamily protein